MKQVQTPLKLMIAGTVVAAGCVIAAPSASAQTTSTTSATTADTAAAADAFTVAPPQTFSKTGKPTSSTPRMVREAIQRSKARSQRLLTQGVPEQWGSEEPFTFDENAQ